MRIASILIPSEEATRRGLEARQTVTLTLAQRRRSRQRLVLTDGVAVGLAIERGAVLHEGDVLETGDGRHIRVQTAREDLLRVTAASPRALARAAYHLGNRHVALEVGEGYLQLSHDPVLADMLTQLGDVTATRVQAAFEPETGAYGGGHHHGHDDTFEEDYALAQAAFQAHEHDQEPEHCHEPAHDHPHDGHVHPHNTGSSHEHPRDEDRHEHGDPHDPEGGHEHEHPHPHSHGHDS
ncbi:Urease accessory protein UreE [Castellaniella defragrans]